MLAEKYDAQSFTHRVIQTSHEVKKYVVERLTEDSALHMLLTHRPALLSQNGTKNILDLEAQAARAICHYVDYLPLSLTLLREFFENSYVTKT